MRCHIQPFKDQKSQGQSLVEFALMFPLLLMIIVGVFDIGRAYYAYVTITNAAREGARGGAGDPTNTSAILAAAEREANSTGVAITDSMITIGCATFSASPAYDPSKCGSLSSGDLLRVQINYPFAPITGQVLGLNSIPMRGAAVMAVAVK